MSAGMRDRVTMGLGPTGGGAVGSAAGVSERKVPLPGVEVRVILVGRTGLDAKLRLDTGVDLVRARTAMEAVGELASPGPAGLPSVVLVGENLEGSMRLFGESAGDLIQALRVVDANVRVVRVLGPSDAAPAIASPFDAILRSDAPVETLRSVLRAGVERGVIEEAKPIKPAGASPKVDIPPAVLDVPVTRPAPVPAPAPAPSASAIPLPAAPADELGDEAIVRALVKGHDVAPAAVEALRRRLGDPTLSFVPRDQTVVESTPVPAAGVVVSYEGQLYGVLQARHLAEALLSKAAQWMALWLRVSEQQSLLREAAFTDALTGAWNRRYFDRFLSAAIETAGEARRSVTVLLFDIDDFKRYNDQFGHEAGDDILREAVALMRSVVRPTDRVCRIGGDEFAVIFNEPQGPRESNSRHPTSIVQIADRFQRQIQEHRFPKLGNEARGMLTISGGLATFPWDGTTAESLVRRADDRAMQSKRAGKNAITIGPGAV